MLVTDMSDNGTFSEPRDCFSDPTPSTHNSTHNPDGSKAVELCIQNLSSQDAVVSSRLPTIDCGRQSKSKLYQSSIDVSDDAFALGTELSEITTPIHFRRVERA